MKYIKHMKILTDYFDKSDEVETTIASLAKILNCSDRHVKSIVNYLNETGFIEWKTEKGRGKKPKIILNYTVEEIQLEEAKRYVDSEKYQEAFMIIEQLGLTAQSRFQQWFSNRLGIVERDVTEKDIDILRYPYYETKLLLDPLFMISRHDSHMVQQLFDRLVEFDQSTGQVVPRIAHHFESKDGRCWTFYLRKGVLFHHGRELTSDDVKATIARFSAEDDLKKNIEYIQCLSDYVIKFYLKQADYLFPRYLSSLKASIVPIDVINKNAVEFRNLPIGSGPYQLVRHDEQMVRLEVFKKYYGLRPWLDQVEIIKTPSLFQLDHSHPFLLTAPNASWKEVQTMEEGADFITFNCRKEGPIQDKSFRKRLFQLINPEEFCLLGEKAAHSFLTEQTKMHTLSAEKKSIKKLTFNGERELIIAAQQIREGVNHEREAKILKEQLNRAGIPAKIEIVNATDFKDSRVIETYDLFVSGIALSDDRLLSVLTSMQSNQVAIYQCLSEEMKVYVNEQITKIKKREIETERWKCYFQLEAYLKSQQAILFLNHRTHTVYEREDSPYVNIELDSNGRIDYRKVWKRHVENIEIKKVRNDYLK